MSVETNRRHWILAIFLQAGIRIRYLFESGFGLIPLFTPITSYPSNWRPKNCPKYDFITQISFVWLWFSAALCRDWSIFYLLFCKIGVVSLANRFHRWACERLMKQMEAANYTKEQREVPIPEYDWENGDPETFYNLFVKRPHPVVLRNFMKGK